MREKGDEQMRVRGEEKGVRVGRLFFYAMAVVLVAVMAAMLSSCDGSDVSEVLDAVAEGRVLLVYGEGDERELDPVVGLPKTEKDGKYISGWYRDKEYKDILEGITDSEKGGIRLYAKWEDLREMDTEIKVKGRFPYDGKSHGKDIEVEGLPEGAEWEIAEEHINAGEYEIEVSIKAYGYKEKKILGELIIEKLCLVGIIRMEDVVYDWDGEPKRIEVSGDIPEGVAVKYIGNEQTKAGEYEVTAEIKGGMNYEDSRITAKLVINRKMFSVRFTDAEGKEIEVKEIEGGDGIDKMPSIEERRGYIGRWSESEVKDVRENKEIRLIYEKERYEIKYNLYGGEIEKEHKKEYSIGDAVTLPEPKREYYEFVGWYDGKGYANEIEEWETGDKVYDANWRAVEYKITYDVQGGENCEENAKAYSVASVGIELKEARRDGYEFVCWRDEEGAEIKEIDTTRPRDIEIRAEWRLKEYSITYVYDGSDIEEGGIHVYTIESGDIELREASKRGYEFKGWSERADGGEVIRVISATICRNVVLYAEFELINYKITYDCNGGEKAEGSPEEYTIESGEIELRGANRSEYRFAGWYDGNGERVEKIQAGSYGDIELYAKWEKEEYETEELGDGGVRITKYKGEGEKVSVTAEIGGYAVKEISGEAFNGRADLIEITIADGVEKIGAGVFAGCSKLKGIRVPFAGERRVEKKEGEAYYTMANLFEKVEVEEGVECPDAGYYYAGVTKLWVENGEWTYSNTPEWQVKIPDALKEVRVGGGIIPVNSFYKWIKLEYVEIEKGERIEIKNCAFRDSGIKTLVVSEEMVEVEDSALFGSTKLLEIYVATDADKKVMEERIKKIKPLPAGINVEKGKPKQSEYDT